MAKNWEKVKEELTCAICQDLLNDPKILPCLHSFCTGCLKEWLGRLTYLEASKSELECPLCRGKVALCTPSAVEELPSHFSAVRLVEILRLQEQASSKEVTPLCQNCEAEVSTSSCSDCIIFLCDFCKKAHRRSKATSGHKLHSLDELRKGATTDIPSALPEKVEMCPVHPTKPLELYCRCEDVLICRDCIIKKHKDHDYDVISDIIDGEKKILKEALPSIQQLIDEVEIAINGVKSKREDVKTRKEENFHNLDDVFHTLHAALDQRKLQLQQQITQDTEEKDKGLAVHQDELCFLLSQLKSCWGFIDDKLQRGVNKDVLAMKKSMLGRGYKLKQLKDKTKLSPVIKEQASLKLKGLEEIMHLFSQLGSYCDVQNCGVENLRETVPIGENVCFKVLLQDSLGNKICDASELEILVQYKDQNQISQTPTIRGIGKGKYEVSYLCKFVGTHTLSVKVGKESIPGSPFNVTATLRDYTKIEAENCKLITQYGEKKFYSPCDGFVTTNNEFIVVDRENQDVALLDRDFKFLRTFGQGSEDSKLNNPVGVSVHCSVVAVSDYDDHVVKKFTLQGDYLSKFGSHGSEDGQFNNPQGLSYNSKGLLYVVDRSNYRVQVFDDKNMFLFKFGAEGSDQGQFQNPRYIALDSNDQVYVTDNSRSSGILVFTEDGQFTTKIKCDYPFAICLTPDDCIITSDVNCLSVFGPTYQLITKFGTQGTERGQFDSIQGIAVSSLGTIFVAEGNNHRLQVITT